MMPPSIILYAEDEENDIFFFEQALQNAGSLHTLKAVADGQQALDYLEGKDPFADRSRHPLPAIVVLDINMPKKSGFEVLEWIRQQPRFKSLPVLILTSSSLQEDMAKARLLGVDDYFLKPSDPRKLIHFAQSFEQVLARCDTNRFKTG
jgi:CheY-like chemotaxis protein